MIKITLESSNSDPKVQTLEKDQILVGANPETNPDLLIESDSIAGDFLLISLQDKQLTFEPLVPNLGILLNGAPLTAKTTVDSLGSFTLGPYTARFEPTDASPEADTPVEEEPIENTSEETQEEEVADLSEANEVDFAEALLEQTIETEENLQEALTEEIEPTTSNAATTSEDPDLHQGLDNALEASLEEMTKESVEANTASEDAAKAPEANGEYKAASASEEVDAKTPELSAEDIAASILEEAGAETSSTAENPNKKEEDHLTSSILEDIVQNQEASPQAEETSNGKEGGLEISDDELLALFAQDMTESDSPKKEAQAKEEAPSTTKKAAQPEVDFSFSDQEIDALLPSVSEIIQQKEDKSFNLEEEIAKLDELFESDIEELKELDELDDLLGDMDLTNIIEEAEAFILGGEQKAGEAAPPPDEEEKEFEITFDDDAEEEVTLEEESTEAAAEENIEYEADFDEEEELLEEEIFDEEEQEEGVYVDVEKQRQEAASFSSQTLMLVAMVVFIVSSIFAIGTFRFIESKNQQYQNIAARGVADISVALYHAQITKSKPFNIPPTDADFLNRSFEAVLSKAYRKSSTIDENGKIKGAPYDLLIYASDDLSKFLVVASPQPGLMQFLNKKQLMLGDSVTMLVHSSKNVQGLNNFLKTTDFNTIDKEDLFNFVKRENIIKTQSLNTPSEDLGFKAPSEIGYKHPGAENNLYNLPRYYKMGESLIDHLKQVLLLQRQDEIVSINNEEWVRGDQILYLTSKAREELTQTVENYLNPSITAKVDLSPDQETVMDIEFIKFFSSENAGSDVAALKPLKENIPSSSNIILNQLSGHDRYSYNEEAKIEEFIIAIDNISKTRSLSLEHISNQITDLIKTNTMKPQQSFRKELDSLLAEYKKQEAEENQRIEDQIRELVFENQTDLASSNVQKAFQETLRSRNLDQIVALDASSNFKETIATLNPDEIRKGIEELENVEDIHAMQGKVDGIVSALNPGNIEDPELLISLQNQLRNQVLRVIGNFILSPNDQISRSFFREENRPILSQILNSSGISEETEREFYLQEFDYLLNQYEAVTELETEEKKKKDLDDPNQTDLSNRLNEIAAQRDMIREKLIKLPLGTLQTTNHSEHVEHIGRLAKQIIIKATLQKPTPERDAQLLEAIELLTEATANNRLLWSDILKARTLLTHTPQINIGKALSNGALARSFKPINQTTIRNQFNNYVREKAELAKINNPEHYKAKFSLFQEKAKSELKNIISETEQIQGSLKTLKENLNLYIGSLTELKDDYQQAVKQGYSLIDETAIPLNILTMQEKINTLNKVNSKLTNVAVSLEEANQDYQQLAKKELEKISTFHQISDEDISELIRKNNDIKYPNLSNTQIEEDLLKTIEQRRTGNGE